MKSNNAKMTARSAGISCHDRRGSSRIMRHFGATLAVIGLALLGSCEALPVLPGRDSGVLEGQDPATDPLPDPSPSSAPGESGAPQPGNSPPDTPDLSADMATTNAVAAVETCQVEGAVRCALAAGAGQRERCQEGSWIPHAPCTDGAVCVLEDGGVGSCQAVAEICQGSAGQSVCDGSGTLHTCSALGVEEGAVACPSARHCQAGVDRGQCAACQRGSLDEYRCEGASLLRCNDASDGYEPVETCEIESACNAVAGACTDSACSPEQTVCDGDTLQRCNADQSAFETVETCPTGLCDAESGACDVCLPGSATCEGNTAAICEPDGTQLNRNACPSAAPACVGNGRCVQCTSAPDCNGRVAPPCQKWECRANECVTVNDDRASCSGGVCVSGQCEQCRVASDCSSMGPPPTCKTWQCSANRCSTANDLLGSCDQGVCVSGSCEECRIALDCNLQGLAPDCKKWECRNNNCAAVTDDTRTCRIGLLTPGRCSAGSCVECLTATDCTGFLPDCQKWECRSGSCMQAPATGGSCNSGAGECASGVCQSLCGNDRVDSGEDCDEGGSRCKSDCTWNLYNVCFGGCAPGALCSEFGFCTLACQGGSCPRDFDGRAMRCIDGACYPTCPNNGRCPTGLTCITGEAVCACTVGGQSMCGTN